MKPRGSPHTPYPSVARSPSGVALLLFETVIETSVFYGFASNLRDALPNASFIGLTT